MQSKVDGLGMLFRLDHFGINVLIIASEAVEDLTGGVTTEFLTADLLDRNKFWTDELLLANKDFLFAAAVSGNEDRSGIFTGHSYSVLKAKEVKGERFVQVRYVPERDSTSLSLLEGRCSSYS